MKPKQILEQARQAIEAHGGGDPDKWFYANRYVFARLQLDERKTKDGVKRELLDSGVPCEACGKPFESKRGVHLHRIDEEKGYSRANCALMHPKCHQDHHASRPARGRGSPSNARPSAHGGKVLVKESKRYEGAAHLYWWDISPGLAERLSQYETVEFVKKDIGERCSVPTQALACFLTEERMTTRRAGNWGVRVLSPRPKELAFEPGRSGGEWLFLPVVWHPRP